MGSLSLVLNFEHLDSSSLDIKAGTIIFLGYVGDN